MTSEIAAVFVLTGVSLLLLYLGLFKQDAPITIFSGFSFVLLGLTTINVGFEELTWPFQFSLGIIFIFLGLYVAIRSAVELISEEQ